MTDNGNIPKIDPVPAGTHRPFWSVMIPTYNCANYLRETLESVLSQDPGPDQMQIEVIDDCSTKDDPEAVVKELGKGRVGFYRQPVNVGPTRNFNTCLQRSRGHWVHILHGDDYVLPRFYHTMSLATQANPEVGLFYARTLIVDEDSELENVSARMKAFETPCKAVSILLYSNPFLAPGVVVRRSAYEAVGGFSVELAHCADWEMWVRVVSSFNGIAVNKPLVSYRMFSRNDTSRLMRTGENITDALKLCKYFRQYPSFDKEKFINAFAKVAYKQAIQFYHTGNLTAAKRNAQVWVSLLGTREFLRHLSFFIRSLDRYGLRLLFEGKLCRGNEEVR